MQIRANCWNLPVELNPPDQRPGERTRIRTGFVANFNHDDKRRIGCGRNRMTALGLEPRTYGLEQSSPIIAAFHSAMHASTYLPYAQDTPGSVGDTSQTARRTHSKICATWLRSTVSARVQKPIASELIFKRVCGQPVIPDSDAVPSLRVGTRLVVSGFRTMDYCDQSKT